MDRSMPAALAVDENGLLDIDKLNADKIEAIKQATKQREIRAIREEAGIGPDSADKEARPGPVTELLRIFRKPELWLINAYRNSAARRKLYEKFDWYRDFEGTHSVLNKLEDVYRGSTNPLGNIAHFLRNNILVSLLLAVLCGQLFAGYLSQPAHNRYTDHRKPARVTDEGTAASLVAAGPGEVELLNNLNHCAVSNHLRRVYDDQQNKTLKRNVLAEIYGFVKVFSDSDLENWYASRAAKREVTVSHIQSALPRIQDYSNLISEEIADVVGKHAEIKYRLGSIDVTTKQGINQFIRVRAQLMRLDDHVRYGPSITRAIAALDSEVLRLRKMFAGSTEDTNAGISRWAVSTSKQNLVTLTNTIGQVVRNDVDANIINLWTDSPETKLYKLQILAATLRDFGDLITHLDEDSNHDAIRVAQTQISSNNKLKKLLGFQDHPGINFLDYDNCLTFLNTAKAKLTSR